jgi:hypothetical protein
MGEFEDAVTLGYAKACEAVADIVRQSRQAASIFDVPESAAIIRTGDTVHISGTSSADGTYEVTKGDSEDTVWVNPAITRSFTMRRSSSAAPSGQGEDGSGT